MIELIKTNELEWGDYSVEFLTEKILKEYLMSEAIPCLSCRFKEPKDFFENLIFKIPKAKKHKNFQMIYSHLVQFYPHDFLEKEELAKKHNLKKEDILAEGSVKLMDTCSENPPLVRWLIVKKRKSL